MPAFFMHMGVQMKYVSKLPDAQRTSSGEGRAPTRLHMGVQMKYVSKLPDAEGRAPTRLHMGVQMKYVSKPTE